MNQTATLNRNDAIMVVIAYVGFIVLGIPGAMLNIAWSPYLHEMFGLPKDALGVLLTMGTIGYFIASFSSGRLIRRLGIGTLLVGSSLLTGVSLLGYAFAPAWLVIVVSALLVGAGAGIMDGGLNIYFAAHFGPRLMNWLHACFGIGATLGAFLIASVINAGQSWNVAYFIAAVLYAGLALTFALTRQNWRAVAPSREKSSGGRIGARDTLRLGIVWAFIALFFIYGGVEVTAPQWASPLYSQNRAVPLNIANDWVSRFWAVFTLGRLFFGVIVHRMHVTNLLRLCMGGSLIGALLLWWNPSNDVGFFGLLLIGFALAPIFALLMTLTQETLGPDHAPNAIGFQVGATSVGIAILPSLAGIIAERVPGASLEVVGPYLVLLAVIMIGIYEFGTRARVRLAKAVA